MLLLPPPIRPVVIMDEGQRAVSDLAYKTLYGFNPSLVLELTATPKDVAPRVANGVADAKPGRIANILVEITGRELEQEGMIKMPMNVASLPGGEWQVTLATAWERLEALERTARAYEGEGGRYIRPILLIQVERTGAEQADAGYIHASDARDWLKSVAGLEDDQVAFKTADTNDLDKPENRDLLSPKCRVRAIITKAALAEGWDCPFAYVLCALAANGNESAMTQLVGRILRQPHATKTDYALPEGSTPLDECYVFARRADTAATVAAIKKGLEGDGLGDLAMDVVVPNSTASNAGAARLIERRATFRAADIALPLVLYCEPGRAARPLDAESDLFPHIDWGTVDLDALAARLPKDRPASDHQLVRLRAGAGGVESEQATAIAGNATFNMGYATRTIAEIVPNAFIGWGLIDTLAGKLRALGWSDALLGQHSAIIVEELRKVLECERDDQAAALFTAGLGDGTVQFTLRGDDRDWRAPATIPTAQAEGAAQLNASHGGPLERSLFLPIYKADLNDAEQSVAVYLDRYDAVRWWHRNGSTRGNYGLRGWRRGNVYPDFVIAAARDDPAGERVVVMETKGEQLADNHDTEYKRVLLDTLTTAFGRTGGTGEQLALASQPFTFGAAVVVFDDLDAQFPALIRGGANE